MVTFIAVAGWLSSLGLAFLLGYYYGSMQRPRNGNGGNGEEEAQRGRMVAL